MSIQDISIVNISGRLNHNLTLPKVRSFRRPNLAESTGLRLNAAGQSQKQGQRFGLHEFDEYTAANKITFPFR